MPSASIVTSKAAARPARRGALARSPPSFLLSAQDVERRSAQVNPRFRRTGVANALVPRAIPSPTTSNRQADTCLLRILSDVGVPEVARDGGTATDRISGFALLP